MTEMNSNKMAALKNPSFDFFSFPGLNLEKELLTRQIVGHNEHLDRFVGVVFVFSVLLIIRSIRCTDRAVGCISQSKIQMLKTEIIVG